MTQWWAKVLQSDKAASLKSSGLGWTHDDGIDSIKLLEDHENHGNDQLWPVLPLAQISCREGMAIRSFTEIHSSKF